MRQISRLIRLPSFKWRIRQLRIRLNTRKALRQVNRPLVLPEARAHGLGRPLIVSLTSYPARFDKLRMTLRSLIEQDVRPDYIMLWVDSAHEKAIPQEVWALCHAGVNICFHNDIGPATKLLPALKEYPEHFIITADDDLYYPPDWIGRLIDAYDKDSPSIVCLRAHLAMVGDDGALLPYRKWDRRTDQLQANEKTQYIFPTGVGGVLYPPGCFSSEVFDEKTLAKLTPKADDVWFFWMARLAGTRQTRAPGRMELINWPGSQGAGLFHSNVSQDGNDSQISAMEKRYGLLSNVRIAAIAEKSD